MSQATELSDRDELTDRSRLTMAQFYQGKVPPQVAIKYFSRLFNRADSATVKNKKKGARQYQQKNGETYQRALRKLAEDVCLETKGLSEARQENLIASRAVLDDTFVQFMAREGVVIDLEYWLWHETVTSRAAARASLHRACQ